MLYAFVLITVLIRHVASRPNGPPVEACSTITPQHGENTASNCGQNCPYSLQVVSINGVSITPLTGTIGYVSASDVFGVDVVASGENVFRGFAVQSRTSTNVYNGNAAFQGGFENMENDSDWQLITCNMNTNGTVGHTSNSDKSQVSLYWMPPIQSVNVTLWFTIVQVFSNFHVQMEGLKMVPAVFCSQTNFCQNNGMCIEANGNFTCDCTPQFTGQNCETFLDPCTSNPCGSSETCIADGELYVCFCSDGETASTPCVSPTSAIAMSSVDSSVSLMMTSTDSIYSTNLLTSSSMTTFFSSMSATSTSAVVELTTFVSMNTILVTSFVSTNVVQSSFTSILSTTAATSLTVEDTTTSSVVVVSSIVQSTTSSQFATTGTSLFSSLDISSSVSDASIISSSSAVLTNTVITTEFTSPTPTISPSIPPPFLQLLSPQPIKIYGRRGTLSIQINATVPNHLGSSVNANTSLLSASLILSINGTISVNISSYNPDSGQLVLIVPSVFYTSYINATFNTSYFEVTLTSPISSLTTSITFSSEYLDVLNLLTEDERMTFAVGESLSMTCITIPPNISVIWEVSDAGSEFMEVANPRVQYDPPSTRTTLLLTNLSLNDSVVYRCRGTDGLANETASNSITVLPDTLTIQLAYSIGETTRSLRLVNRSAFVLSSQDGGNFLIFCIGLLGDNDTEITADTVNSTAGFMNNMYSVTANQPLDNSGDFVVISFFQFLFSYSGNFTCRSRSSGLEQTVFVSSNPLDALAMLLSPSTARVTLGDDAVFVYRIALANDQNVINNVNIRFNLEITAAEISTIVEQGNDIYHVIFSNVSSLLNQAEFVLEFNGNTISSTATIAVLSTNVSIVPDRFAVSSVGESVTLSCTPGDTSLSIDWYREYELLTASTKYIFSPAIQRYMLTITDIQLNDASDYYCTVEDNEVNDNLKITLIVIEDPIVMFLDNEPLPPVAVINVLPPSTLRLICTGTERFTLTSNIPILPNPVVPGYYRDSDGGLSFSVAAFNDLIVLTITDFTELPSTIQSFNCTSLESSAVARLFSTNDLFVASLNEEMTVLYGEPFSIPYTIASSSNGTENVVNDTIELFIEFENSMTIEPTNLDLDLLSIVSGNYYQLTIPSANSTTAGNYRLIAEAFGEELFASATVSVRNILPTISVVGNVYELAGCLVRLECDLSFPGSSVVPSVPVTWYKFDGDSYIDTSQLDNVQLTSNGSRYSLLFESVGLDDASTYVCAIVEDEMRIVEEYTELVVFKNDINIGYDTNRLVPSGAIINQFSLSDRSRRSDFIYRRNALPSMPTGALTLDCFAVTGQENPYWEVTDNELFNGTILPNLTLQIGDSQATISVVPVSTYITVINFDIFPTQLSGTYTCKSSPDGPASSVFITTRSPFVRSLIASPLKVSQCELVDLLFQVAQSSDGTAGSNNVQSVRIEQFRNNISFRNFTFPPPNQQIVTASFTAFNLQSGNYFAYLPEEPNVRDSVELIILYPSATLLNDRNVVSLMGRNVTLGCVPSNQTLEVRWILYRDDGTRVVLSPNGRRDIAKRLDIQDDQPVFDPPGLYHQITIINASLGDTGNYSCEILPNCGDPFTIAQNMTLTIVPAEVNIGYNDRNLLPSGTVINDFVILDNIGTSAPTTPPPSQRRRHTKQKKNTQPDHSFQLECITVMGQENPYWEISNSVLYNGIITPNLTLSIGELETTIFIIYASSYRTIINFNTFNAQLSGNYTCRSSPTGPSSSVVITTRNPFVRVLTPTPLNVSQCQIASVIFQAALNSNGLSNSVDTIALELFQNGLSIEFSSFSLLELQLSLQIFQLDIRATSFQDGQYYLYLPIDPSERDSFEIIIQYPTLTLINDERITVLRGSVVTFECIPSDMKLPVRWIFYGADGSVIRIFPDDSKRQAFSLGSNIEMRPLGLFHQLTVYNVQLMATGNFSCEIVPPCPDNIVIAQNTSLTVQPACDEDFDVVFWPRTPVASLAMFRCADIHPSFRFGPYITRMCRGERWDPVNFTQCTIRTGSSPLLTVSVILQSLSEPNPIVIQNEIMNDTNFTEGIAVTVQFEEEQNEYLVFILIELPPEVTITSNYLSPLVEYFNSPEPYGRVSRGFLAYLTAFKPNDVCYCDAPVAVSDGIDDSKITDPSLFNIVDVCIGPAISPCICSAATCKCNSPAYSGNGTVCARDSDEDTLPDVDLGCDEIFCEKDACPLMQNLLPDGTQDISVCQPISQGELSCREEGDEYNIVWPATTANTNVTLSCPSGAGNATRFCDSSGNWEPSNVRGCRSYEYIVIAGEAQALNAAPPEVVAEMSADIIDSLATITGQVENTSALPLDLGTTVDILTSVLSTTNSSRVIEQEEFVNDVIQVYNNILNTTNTPGWMDLQQINRTQSQLLLLNAEQFSFQWASTLNISENRTIASENIVISAEAVDVDNEQSISDVSWPTPDIKEQAELFKSTVPFASVMIPGDLIQRRGMASANRVVLIANTAYRNFESILPTSINVTSNQLGVTQAVGLILSSQVAAVGSSTLVAPSDEDPVVLMFEYSMNSTDTNLRCGFWDFELDQGSGVAPGGWSSVGLNVETMDDDIITCSSTHLTSFAVLVDVSGGSQDIPEGQKTALSAVTYIGASISIACLILAIVMFIVYRNSLLKGLHNFIHLNLAIALALALLVFVTGIETATGNDGGCTFVAFLLHYFFTAVFTWMLCEGIMLYFLLVKVFNTGIGQRKLLYLSLGWGIPIPIVIIAVGIAHDQYGTDEYCWISTEEGAIWAFVVPMLVIITVNIFFLGLALRAIYNSKQSKISNIESSKVETVKAILKATVVLLPLLGVTWVFGILAVNEESVAFAWIFTILNSFQGVFIFVLHVLRNEKVKGKIKSFFGAKGKYFTATSGGESTTNSSRFKTTRSNKGFTTKVKVKTDEEAVELDSKGPLDDHSEVEPGMYVNPEVVADSNDEKPVASNDDETKDTSTYL